MSSPIEPFADIVIIQLEKVSNKTASGIIIPESAQQKPKTAKVVAVGPEVNYAKVGDKVAYKENFDDDTITIDKEEYILVKEQNVRGKIK